MQLWYKGQRVATSYSLLVPAHGIVFQNLSADLSINQELKFYRRLKVVHLESESRNRKEIWQKKSFRRRRRFSLKVRFRLIPGKFRKIGFGPKMN